MSAIIYIECDSYSGCCEHAQHTIRQTANGTIANLERLGWELYRDSNGDIVMTICPNHKTERALASSAEAGGKTDARTKGDPR